MTETLSELFKKIGVTDKHTRHSYDYFYESLLRHKKETATHILEIGVVGVATPGGGELQAFAEYFPNAEIHGIDIVNFKPTHPNVIFHLGDGYDEKFLSRFDEIEWDVVLDDGPHTKESQLFTLNYFFDKIKKDGIVMVEDVKQSDTHWIVNNFTGDKKRLSIIDRAHTSNTEFNDEYILLYM